MVKQAKCILCHTIDGVGGHSGPELTGDGSKTEAEWIEFHRMTYVQGEKDMKNWIYQHFVNPQKIEPLSGMPVLPIEDPVTHKVRPLNDDDIKALTIYILSLKDPAVESIPQRLLPVYQKSIKKSNCPVLIPPVLLRGEHSNGRREETQTHRLH